jgi:hypothetical protein
MGKNRMPLDDLLKIATVLKIEVREFLSGFPLSRE